MRVLYFCVVVFLLIAVHPVLGCLAAIVYAFRYTAYELIILGFLLDALFGFSGAAFGYTLMAAVIFFAAEFLKPFLAFYEKRA